MEHSRYVIAGDFEGDFDNGDRIVDGHCTGKTISFIRVDRTGEQKFYLGVFQGRANKFIHGVRIGFRRARPDDETWDGTKTGGEEDDGKKPSRTTKKKATQAATKKRGSKKK